MKRMTKRAMAVAAAATAFGWAGLTGSAGAQTPTSAEVDPGVYVLPTQVERQPATTQPTAEVRGVSLARTGSDAAPMVVAGGSLAAAGAVLVVAARRRRISTA